MTRDQFRLLHRDCRAGGWRELPADMMVVRSLSIGAIWSRIACPHERHARLLKYAAAARAAIMRDGDVAGWHSRDHRVFLRRAREARCSILPVRP